MAVFQPKFRAKEESQLKKDPSDTIPLQPEYSDILPSAGYNLFKFPTDIEKTLNNVAMFVFNTVENIEKMASQSNIEPSVYYKLMGGSTWEGEGSATLEIPLRNRAWATIQQEMRKNKVLGAAQKVANKVDKEKAAQVKSEISTFARRYKRTDVGVILPMPDAIRYPTAAGWADVDAKSPMGQLLNIALGESTVKDKVLKELANTISTGLVHSLGDSILGDNMGSALTKSMENSWQDQAFSGMERRTFEFSWTVAPRNRTELEQFVQIIQLFRFQAHPSLDAATGGNYLIFPGQIDVEWYTREENTDNFVQNGWMPKIASCVIVGIETDYTPNNQFSYFKNAGAPTHYTLRITLKETVPLTKIDVARGF